jgi:predicted RNase H-like nuclease
VNCDPGRMCDRGGMRVTGVDACRGGWVAVSLDVPQADRSRAGKAPEGAAREGAAREGAAREGAAREGGFRVEAMRVHASLAGVLEGDGIGVVGIDMPLGLLESGWREADLAARGLLGPRRSSVFAIPPRAVWAETTYQAANQRCRELTGQGFSIQAWGLRAKLLEAGRYRGICGHRLHEVHPELAFGAMAGAPLGHSKHTAAGRDLRRALLSQVGLMVPMVPLAPVADTLDAAAVAWSAWRIAAGRAVTLPDRPQHDGYGRQIAIRY